MTAYTVAAGHNSVEPWTTTPNQVDTVTFTSNVGRVQVISDGAAEVRVTIDGSTPTIGGAPGSSSPAFRLPAGALGIVDLPLSLPVDVLTLVSSGAAKVSVQTLV